MNKYLLLRDNKQTGPYSAEELVKKGLKAYDLVWLEGKSAAWRYPSELEELAPFAPAVEEQPYDRFFKRSSSAQEHAIQAAEQQVKPQVNTAAKQQVELFAEPSPHQIAANHTTQQQNISNTQTGTGAQYEQQAEQVVKTASGKVYVTLPAGMRRLPSATQAVSGPAVKPEQTIVPQQQTSASIQLNQQSSANETGNTTGNESLAVPEEASKALEDRAAALARSVQQAAATREEQAKAVQSSQASQHMGSGNQSKKEVKKVSQADAAREYASQKKAEKAAGQSSEEKKSPHNSFPVKQPVFSTLIAATSHDTEEKVPVIPIRKHDKYRMYMRGIVAACCLLGGIVIGMALTYDKNQSQNQAALDALVERLQAREMQKQESIPANTVPVNTVTEPRNDYAEEASPPPPDEHSAIPASNRPLLAKKLAAVNNQAGNGGNEEPAVAYVEKTPARVSQAVVSSREEYTASQPPDLSAAREKIYQMVKVDASSFRTGVLGGISELHFTISNNSSFPLDQIELEVKYLGPENRVVKVQRLLFNDIAAGSEKTLEAPRTARGVSIDYAVTKIHSRALGIARAGL